MAIFTGGGGRGAGGGASTAVMAAKGPWPGRQRGSEGRGRTLPGRQRGSEGCGRILAGAPHSNFSFQRPARRLKGDNPSLIFRSGGAERLLAAALPCFRQLTGHHINSHASGAPKARFLQKISSFFAACGAPKPSRTYLVPLHFLLPRNPKENRISIYFQSYLHSKDFLLFQKS